MPLTFKCFSYFSQIKKSLQVLGLQPPITQKAIKAKYFELAKLSHPDVAESKNLQSKFVEITVAYNYLSQRSEEEINHREANEQAERNEDPVGAADKRSQREREQTNSYFNMRRYRGQNIERPKISLLRQFPQLFVGFFIVFLFLCEWAYMASKKTIKNQQKISQVNVQHLDSFKSLNFRKRFTVKENSVADLEKQI